MEQLTKRLTDTATILGNIPRMIDLADERELAILAALVKGYGECEEVKRIWQAVDQYLEGIALAALATEGGAITKDVVCTRRVGVLEDAVRYVRSGEAPEGGKPCTASGPMTMRYYATHCGSQLTASPKRHD